MCFGVPKNQSRFSAFFLFSTPNSPAAADLLTAFEAVAFVGPATFELAVDNGDGATLSLVVVDVGKSEVGRVSAGEGKG